MLMTAATVVQVLQDLFYVLLQVLFYLWSLLKTLPVMSCENSAVGVTFRLPLSLRQWRTVQAEVALGLPRRDNWDWRQTGPSVRPSTCTPSRGTLRVGPTSAVRSRTRNTPRPLQCLVAARSSSRPWQLTADRVDSVRHLHIINVNMYTCEWHAKLQRYKHNRSSEKIVLDEKLILIMHARTFDNIIYKKSD